MPNIPESYVHRIGRTARAGSDGIAISLCDNTEVDYLVDIEKLINQKLPREKVLEDGSRKEVFYDPMDDRDHSLKIKKKNSRSRHRKKSLKVKGSKNFQPQLDKEVNKSLVKSGKKKIKKKKNKKFHAKLEKVKNTNLSDEFHEDNIKKKPNNFKSSKQKKKTKSKKSYKDQPKANDRPRKKIK
jgi:ATP-dependent RNA helicase RhlE